jgi:cytochrome P450
VTTSQSAVAMSEIPDLGDPVTFAAGVPYAAFAAVHAKGGLHWQPAERGVVNGGFWFVARRDAIIEMENDPERFTATRGMAYPTTGLDPETNFGRDTIFNMDPPRHSRVRRAAIRSFGPRVVAHFREWVTDIVVEALDEALAKDRFDYVQEVAVTVPSRVIARIMGVPDADRQKIVDWSVATFTAQALRDRHMGQRAAVELSEYATHLQQVKTEHPQEDVVTELAGSVASGDLTQVEFLEYVRGLTIAGFETTHTVIGQSMRMLLEEPEVARAFERSMATAGPGPVVEEFLRCTTPAMHFARTATRDMEFHGQQLRELDVMVMSYAAANRDPSFYAEPDAFLPGRENGDKHLAFGSGAHRCIGQALARLEMEVLFQELARRGVRLELDGAPQRGMSTFINQLLALPVRRAG